MRFRVFATRVRRQSTPSDTFASCDRRVAYEPTPDSPLYVHVVQPVRACVRLRACVRVSAFSPLFLRAFRPVSFSHVVGFDVSGEREREKAGRADALACVTFR